MIKRMDGIPLREWEYDPTLHTRYDRMRTIASPETMQLRFLILGVINVFVAFCTFTLIASILRSPTVRKDAFNIYVLGTAIPDFISSFFCAITCLMSAPKKAYYSEAMCGFQSFYLTLGFTSNCWINAVISHEIYTLLCYSNRRRRYFPPTRSQAIKHLLAVYSYSTVLGLLGSWNISWLPHKTFLKQGLACTIMEYDTVSTFVYWLVFVPAFFAIPSGYALYVLFQVYYHQLMPPQGRSRILSMFFFRIIFVYLVMWAPFVVLINLVNYVHISSWLNWTGSAWSHLQGAVSVGIAMTKPDIREALVHFVTGRQPLKGGSGNDRTPNTEQGASLFLSSTLSIFTSLRNLVFAEQSEDAEWDERDGDIDGSLGEDDCMPEEVNHGNDLANGDDIVLPFDSLEEHEA